MKRDSSSRTPLPLALWQSRLHRIAASSPPGTGLVLAIIERRAVHYLHAAERSDFDKEFAVDISCFTKSITATLLLQAVSKLRFSLDCPVSALPYFVPLAGVSLLQGLTLRHLLNHSHGLDVSLLEGAPLLCDGRIDAQAICVAAVAVGGRAQDRHYSYSAAGYWLIAAFLEHIYGLPFSQLLARQLFVPLEMMSGLASITTDKAVCPAEGRGLKLSAHDLLAFLKLHLEQDFARRNGFYNLHELVQAPLPLPGWLPREEGSLQGWKDFSGGWAGHNGMRNRDCVLVRFNPLEGIGLVMVGNDYVIGNKAFLSLFHDFLPEFAPSRIRAPRLLSDAEWHRCDLARYCSDFGNARWRISIREESGLRLVLRVSDSQSLYEHNPVVSFRLRPAEKHIFLAEALNPTHTSFERFIKYVQFLNPREDGGFDHLWNGQELWRFSAAF